MIFVTEESKARMKAVLEAKTDNFLELCKRAGLDTKKDLRYSDLDKVDFTGCDLRGCDLTGASLRNATGVQVIWDKTTIMTDADLEGSIFEVEP